MIDIEKRVVRGWRFRVGQKFAAASVMTSGAAAAAAAGTSISGLVSFTRARSRGGPSRYMIDVLLRAMCVSVCCFKYRPRKQLKVHQMYIYIYMYVHTRAHGNHRNPMGKRRQLITECAKRPEKREWYDERAYTCALCSAPKVPDKSF